ncbi:hypothetical protein [Streptomyces sp. NPDC055243]|uniref:hypothetical protein n=1 Tax=Streptomyces sp. NPDC055243 TaxID=3365720 RepID=UPI0037D85901
MPLVALIAAVFVVGFEQIVQWQFGTLAVVGVLLLTIGIKAKSDQLADLRVPRRAMSLAAALAGRRRPHLRADWAAVLAGDPESGQTLSSWAQLRLSFGFLGAAIRMRLSDLCGPLWVPVEWLLRVERRTNTAIALVVGAQSVYIVGDGGLPALVTEIWEPCAILGGALYVLARWLRRIREIELAAARTDDPPGEQ